jgi:hypothetical protein
MNLKVAGGNRPSLKILGLRVGGNYAVPPGFEALFFCKDAQPKCVCEGRDLRFAPVGPRYTLVALDGRSYPSSLVCYKACLIVEFAE